MGDTSASAVSEYSPDNVRVPEVDKKPGAPDAAVFRLMAIPGQSNLDVIPDDVAPPPLPLPEGADDHIERLLMRAELETAKQLLSEIEVSDDVSKRAVASATARAHLLEGQLDAAKEVLKSWPDDALSTVRAAVALSEGRVSAARTLCDDALRDAPEGLIEVYVDALVTVAEGKPIQAQMRFSEVCRAAPEHAVARHQLGQLLAAAGDTARAGTLFEQALVIAPGFLPPALALAEMFIDGRQYGEAMALLSEMAERRPELLAPRLLQLKVLLAVGELTPAQELAEALTRAAPGHAEVQLLAAEVQWRRGDAGGAERTLAQLTQQPGDEVRVRAYRQLAQLSVQSSPPGYDRALKNLEEAYAIAPHDGEIILELVELAYVTGNEVRANEALDSLLGMNGPDLSALLNGAVMAQNHGHGDKAKALGDRAMELVRGTGAEEQVSSFVAQFQ